MKKHDIILWVLFAALLSIRCTTNMTYWILLSLISCVIAIVLLIKNKLPSVKYIALSAVFAVGATAAYLGYQRNPVILLYGLTAGIPTLLSSLAVLSVMERQGSYVLLSDGGSYSTVRNILIAIAAGAILSVINTLLPGETGNAGFSLWKLLLALNPALFEEMACRAIFMSYCIYYSHGEKMSRWSTFTMYFMMFVPHTVIHGYDLGTTVVLGVLFGLPFALLQRKCSIASAMISHGIVDAVRFILTGI